MKYRAYFITLGLLLCALTGCSSYKDYLEDESDAIGETVAFSDYKYDQERMQILSNGTPMAIAESGYYYIANNILHFYNINSDIDTALCSRVDCSHRDSICDAYVYTTSPWGDTVDYSCNCLDEMIAYYDDSLYLIERTADSDFYLCRYNSSFNNREKLSTLASVAGSQTAVSDVNVSIISQGYLYYFTSIYDPQYAQKDYMIMFQCNRIKLEKDAVPETLGEFEFPGDYAMMLGDSSGLGMFNIGGDIYFLAGGVGRAYTTNDAIQYRVMKYSTVSESFDMLWTYTGNDKYDVWGEGTANLVAASGGEAMYMDDLGYLYIQTASEEVPAGKSKFQNQIVKVHLEEGTAEVIYKTSFEHIWSVRGDGELLYFFETKPNVSYLTAIDKEGNVVASTELEYTEKTLNSYAAFKERFPDSDMEMPTLISRYMVFYGIDDRYLLIGSYADGFKGLSSTDQTIDYNMAMVGVGVLDKQSFLNGENVEMHQVYQNAP